MSEIDPLKNAPSPQYNTPSIGASDSLYSPSSLDSSSGSGFSSFENILGKKDAAVFKANLCNAISQQISHDQKRAKKAAEKLKKALTGQDMYDS